MGEAVSCPDPPKSWIRRPGEGVGDTPPPNTVIRQLWGLRVAEGDRAGEED